MNRTDRYRLEALLELTAVYPNALAAEKLACRRAIPRPYLSRLVGELARQSLLRTRRGPGGGVTLARPGHEIALADVLTVQTAEQDLPAGLDRLAELLRTRLEELLQATSLADLAAWEQGDRGLVDYAI